LVPEKQRQSTILPYVGKNWLSKNVHLDDYLIASGEHAQ
jgi:hypothetical protein